MNRQIYSTNLAKTIQTSKFGNTFIEKLYFIIFLDYIGFKLTQKVSFLKSDNVYIIERCS